MPKLVTKTRVQALIEVDGSAYEAAVTRIDEVHQKTSQAAIHLLREKLKGSEVEIIETKVLFTTHEQEEFQQEGSDG